MFLIIPVDIAMQSQQKRVKARKGSVQIKNSNGRLQIVFSHPIVNEQGNIETKRFYLSTGREDTSANRHLVAALAATIERDITYGELDLTLSKYMPASSLSTVTPITPTTPIASTTSKEPPKLDIKSLWERYSDYKQPQVSSSTMQRDYGKIAKRLTKMPHSVRTAIDIRDWLLKNYSSEVTRRTLIQLNACCKWAVKSKLLDENPFAELAKDIKKTVRDTSREAFSSDDINAIIYALENNLYSQKYSPIPHSYYANYIKFLFATGCRPEEAIALQWQHIAPDCTRIYFRDAIPSDTGIRGETKTGKARSFPCNPKLQIFLKEIKPEDFKPECLVFPGPRGNVIDSHNFLNRVWSPVVKALVSAGKVERYLPQYNIRHTFVTLALEHGLDAKDVARLVGNSPEVIYRHYAGNKRELFVPEF